MFKDTLRALVYNDIIAKNVCMSEQSYWVFEQINSEIDLLVLDERVCSLERELLLG